MKTLRRRLDVDVEELDRVIDAAENGPLSKADRQKLKTTLHALVERLAQMRNTEKTKSVLEQKGLSSEATESPEPEAAAPAGHGRHAASAFTGAEKVSVRHAQLKPGDPCPECREGRVYRQKQPKTQIRIEGQAPLKATVFEMECLRCNACCQVFTAAEPMGVGAGKYDLTAVAMIALLKYGTGMPFNRMERLETQLGIPLPAATQWELMEPAAGSLEPIMDELILQAAQGSVVHNDDTGMRILKLVRNAGDGRTGTFTSGIVSIWREWRIALYFTGWKHAGENLANVLKQRAAERDAPIQMCDALSRNAPKLPGMEVLLANCLAHGRRQVVDVAANFPEECRYVLETLGKVYQTDAQAREQQLSPESRLLLHQEHSGPLLDELRQWMETQFAEHNTEPNSGLGKAISYLQRHWTKLTLFLRQPGAPLDNNIAERALKKAICTVRTRSSIRRRTARGWAISS